MNILVAGAGHGGLVAAGLLAKRGHGVKVFERGAEETLGHDWTDIFDLTCLQEAGIPMPPPEEYQPSGQMTFVSPSRKYRIETSVPEDECLECFMERRDILRHLVAFARENGAEILFGKTVEKPLIENNRVAGLVVDGEALRADLVIDAAGMNSPVRSQLPAAMGIVKSFRRDQYFSAFRAFFARKQPAPQKGAWTTYFFPMGHRGIAWIADEEAYFDMLFGHLEDNSRAIAEEVRRWLLPLHPEMRCEIYRGGQVVSIPVRRPISRMVADGYAAIGDAAAMTIPLIGSGICNSIRAAVILADTVCADQNKANTTAALWPYQAAYMRQVGAPHAALDVLKAFMLSMPVDKLDALFEHRLIEEADMVGVRNGNGLGLTPGQMAVKAVRGAGHLPTLLRMAGVLNKSEKLGAHARAIPEVYDEARVKAWAEVYDGF